MKLLHTSDWHVGRTIRGRSRAVEHEEVLKEIAGIAAAEAVDLVVVAGDLFDTAAPSPESERIVYRALLDLESTGARVVVIAGNHDSARRLVAVAPVLDRGRISTVARFALPPDGIIDVLTPGGEDVQVAAIPFLSHRTAIRADELMATDASEQVQVYAATVAHAIQCLCAAFRPGAVHVVVAHLFTNGGLVGDPPSERLAHTVFGYAVSPQVFPPSVHYVALGHLHRPQPVGAPFIRYAGSPLQLDFGEAGETKSVTVVEASAATPARVREVPLTAGRRLRELKGSLEQLRGQAANEDMGDDHLKVYVNEPARAGLADDVRALFENCVDVVIDSPDRGPLLQKMSRAGKSPADLLHEYLDDSKVQDPRLDALFAELLTELDEHDDAPVDVSL